MKKLGVAVIGTGFWGKNHARVYKELESTELIAVCDVNPERAKNIANQYGVEAYTSTSRMLKNNRIEAVNICTWSTKLAKEALKALKMKKVSHFWKKRFNPYSLNQELPAAKYFEDGTKSRKDYWKKDS